MNKINASEFISELSQQRAFSAGKQAGLGKLRKGKTPEQAKAQATKIGTKAPRYASIKAGRAAGRKEDDAAKGKGSSAFVHSSKMKEENEHPHKYASHLNRRIARKAAAVKAGKNREDRQADNEGEGRSFMKALGTKAKSKATVKTEASTPASKIPKAEKHRKMYGKFGGVAKKNHRDNRDLTKQDPLAKKTPGTMARINIIKKFQGKSRFKNEDVRPVPAYKRKDGKFAAKWKAKQSEKGFKEDPLATRKPGMMVKYAKARKAAADYGVHIPVRKRQKANEGYSPDELKTAHDQRKTKLQRTAGKKISAFKQKQPRSKEEFDKYAKAPRLAAHAKLRARTAKTEKVGSAMRKKAGIHQSFKGNEATEPKKGKLQSKWSPHIYTSDYDKKKRITMRKKNPNSSTGYTHSRKMDKQMGNQEDSK